MTKPYLLFSDVHAHAWSQFSTTLPNGRNSRLQIILDELDRAFDGLETRGGETAVFAGDLFHTRGQIDPEVFNPVFEFFANLSVRGFRIIMIPGNHDLKGKETEELGNAMQSLGKLEGITIHTKPTLDACVEHGFCFIPWISNVESLKNAISTVNDPNRKHRDLIIHGGIDGSVRGLPDHGFSANWLAAQGFKRVFSGHYHNHHDFGSGIYSIGATTQQTFSDIGTLAGVCYVYPDRVEFAGSHAPRFISIDATTDMNDLPLLVPGNYVRVRDLKLTDTEIKDLRKEIENLGAKGCSIEVPRAVVAARPAQGTSTVRTLSQSVHGFVDDMKLEASAAASIKAECDDILTSVQAAA